MRAEELWRLERAERMMIRRMCGVTLKDRCKSDELRKRLEIEDVEDVVRKSRLGWFDHLERKTSFSGLKLSYNYYRSIIHLATLYIMNNRSEREKHKYKRFIFRYIS